MQIRIRILKFLKAIGYLNIATEDFVEYIKYLSAREVLYRRALALPQRSFILMRVSNHLTKLIGTRIRQKRRQLLFPMSRKELAVFLRISIEEMKDFEAGKALMTEEGILSIAKILCVKPNELALETDEMKIKQVKETYSELKKLSFEAEYEWIFST